MADYLPLAKRVFERLVRDFTSFGSPFILSFLSLAIMGLGREGIAALAGLILIEAFCDSIKLAFHKPRPKKMKYSNALEKIDAGSFPSVHSARSAFVPGMIFIYLQSQWALLLFALPIIVGITRIKLKKHDIKDVIGGWAIGLAFLIAYAAVAA